jgi:hypothetical protein
LANRFSFSQWQARVTAGIGGIAAIAASWGIGLFESRVEPPPPPLSAGRPITAGEWDLRLDSARLSDRMPDGSGVFPSGRKAIVLVMQATNRTGETSASFLQAIKLDTPIAGIDAQPLAYLLRDRALATQLQPALPEQVALVWTYPAATKMPAQLRFAVVASNFVPLDNLYAQPIWLNPHTIGDVAMRLVPDAGGAVS